MDIFLVGLGRNGEDYNGYGLYVVGIVVGNILYDVLVYGLVFDEEVSDGYFGEFMFD